jgi:dipeptide transport system permease protein
MTEITSKTDGENPQMTTEQTDSGAVVASTEVVNNYPHPIVEFWQYFRANKGAVFGLVVLVLLVLMAIFAPLLAPHPPNEQYRDALLMPPAWAEQGSMLYPLGTDDLGRDLLSRIMYGAQVSLTTGSMVVVLAVSFGILLGLLAGYFRGLVDIVITRLMDVMLAVPSLLSAIVIVAILGPSLLNAALAVVITQLPHFVRLTRSSVISEMPKPYVTASQVAGASHLRLMFNTILPNCLAPLIVQATLGISTAILDLAALGFLGMGAQPPTPEWGTMLSGSLQFMQRAPWMVTFPGLFILITVLCFNLMGDGLRDALDPKLKR